MKHIVKDFLMRGMVAAGFGPLALVVFYLITAHHAGLETISVSEVCTGILSLTALAFIAGGMNVIYQIERLPLMAGYPAMKMTVNTRMGSLPCSSQPLTR